MRSNLSGNHNETSLPWSRLVGKTLALEDNGQDEASGARASVALHGSFGSVEQDPRFPPALHRATHSRWYLAVRKLEGKHGKLSHERKKENVMYSSIMPRHVWFGEASLLLRSSKPGIKYHIHYTHTAQDTAKAQVIDCCWWLCFFLYAGAGRGECGGGGVGIGYRWWAAGWLKHNPDLTFQGKFNCSLGGRGHKTVQLQCLSRAHSAAELHRPAGGVNGRPWFQ